MGWVAGEPVEVDCPSGCVLGLNDLGGLRPPPGNGSNRVMSEHEHYLAQWSRDLCSQATRLKEQAASACEASAATVAASQGRRTTRVNRC